MNTTTPSTAERVDRLYALLPTVHRMRDADRGHPLKALLRVIAEQMNIVDDDIAGLYENWFVETADDWALPYIGELVGYRPVAETGLPADAPACENPRVLVPRREIANLIASRRRKGTLALLEELANDVAGWPARAVEFFKLLARTQNVNHLYLDRHRLVDLRELDALDRIDGPFDAIAHTVDIRRIGSRHDDGLDFRSRYNIPSVGVFAFRLQSHSVTDTPANCVESAGPHCFTFSVLGQDAPLFVAPQREAEPTQIAGELSLPAAIRRFAFDQWPGRYYGEALSLSVRAEGWAGAPGDSAIPVTQVMPADLSGWVYAPPPGFIAIDPVLGRIAFPANQLPKKGVRVRYRYGFPGTIGGGEYPRPVVSPSADAVVYRVGEGDDLPYHRIGDALAKWRAEQPEHAIVEIVGSGVYVEPISIELREKQSLSLRAAERSRPVLRLIDWQTDLPDALTVTMGEASSITFDGLLVTGRPVRIQSADQNSDGIAVDDTDAACRARVVIRHCTFVPGWAIGGDCEPRRPAEASLELANVHARVTIVYSIIGTISISEDEVRRDPIPVCIENSIIDSTDDASPAIGAPADGIAHAVLTMRNCTVFGIVDVHAMALAENSLFTGCVNVARRQIGCLRYCYVPCHCRTPRRYRCQPDGVIAAAKERLADPAEVAALAAAIASEKLRVAPQFTARRYGKPAYAQLGERCADEIRRGADDESEMGAWHDLFQPQREASLRARLSEYAPAGTDAGLLFAN